MSKQSFEDLEIYQLSCHFRTEVAAICKQFPSSEKFLLSQQLLRSSRKCPANIAEGYGRYHYKERIQYFRIAIGSLNESLEHLR